MVNFGYPYNDIVICKDSTDYLLLYYMCAKRIKFLMTRLSVCGLGVSCNEMSDILMLLVVDMCTKVQGLPLLLVLPPSNKGVEQIV